MTIERGKVYQAFRWGEISVITTVALVLALSCLILTRPRVHSDGTAYYAMALSLVLDRDLDISNQRAEAGHAKLVQRTGKWVRPFLPGFALFYWPVLAPFVAVEQSCEPLRRLSLVVNSEPVGIPPPLYSYCPLSHSVAILAGSMFYGGVALFFSYRICRLAFNPILSIASVVACLLATHLVGYVLNWPSFSHALDAAVVSVGFWLLLRATGQRGEAVWPWGVIGAAFGAAVAVRPANSPLIVAVAVLALMSGGSARTRAAKLGVAATGCLPWLIFLGCFRWSTMGSPFATGYQQSPITWPKYALPYLLSSPDALLQWSPMVAFSVAGWFVLGRGPIRRSVVVPFACFALALGCWGNPVTPGRHGSAFGARYFVQFLGLYSLGLCSFWRATRSLSFAGRVAFRAGLGVTVLYSVWLVPLCWLETPDLGVMNKATAPPHEIAVAGLARMWPRCVHATVARESGPRTRLHVQTKESLLDLLCGRWNPLGSAWPATMVRMVHTRDIVPAHTQEFLAPDRVTRGFRLSPLVRGLPCVSSFWLPRPGCDGVRAGFDRWQRAVSVGAWDGKRAYEEAGFAIFGEPGQDGNLLHAVLPPLKAEEDLVWRSDPGDRCIVTVQRISWEQLDLLVVLWAASKVMIAEGFASCRVPGANPVNHLGPRGDVWAWEIGPGTMSWQTAPVADGASPAVALALAYRGDATVALFVESLGLGTVDLSGDDARFLMLPRASVWMTAPEVRRRRHERSWSHRCLLIFLKTPLSGRGRSLMMGARSEGSTSSSVRVLSYGDTWRHLREQALARAQ
jgi:hypothetical protein